MAQEYVAYGVQADPAAASKGSCNSHLEKLPFRTITRRKQDSPYRLMIPPEGFYVHRRPWIRKNPSALVGSLARDPRIWPSLRFLSPCKAPHPNH